MSIREKEEISTVKKAADQQRESAEKFEMLEEMFRQKDAEAAKKKRKQLIFSLSLRKKGKHEL